jgi:hypothetical protein
MLDLKQELSPVLQLQMATSEPTFHLWGYRESVRFRLGRCLTMVPT